MPTTMRRITISLPPALDEALLALAKCQGKPQARIIIETLNEFVPTFEHMVIITEQSRTGHVAEAKLTAKKFMGEALLTLLDASETINNVGKK